MRSLPRHAYSVSQAWAAGAMVATPSDAARFIRLLANGELLPPAEQAEMMKGVDTDFAPLRYGLGVMLFDPSMWTAGAGPAIGHGGDIIGYHTLTFHFPDVHLTLSSAVDSDEGNPNDAFKSALKALFSTTSGPERQTRREVPALPRPWSFAP